MAKQAWVLRIELDRFFEKKKELRARVSKGTLKDRILFGVYEKTLRDEFSASDVQLGLKEGFIVKEQIRQGVAVRNVFCWTERECQYQPVWHKRQWQKFSDWLKRKGFLE